MGLSGSWGWFVDFLCVCCVGSGYVVGGIGLYYGYDLVDGYLFGNCFGLVVVLLMLV